ncbi:MAG: hypothetical protein ACLFQV_07775 [Vulcanimicrobiota bacterium]
MSVYQGIEIGTTKIRKITVNGRWGNVNVVENAKPQKKILVLSAPYISFRQFHFPFQDKKRIREILPGELVDTLSLPLDKVDWDISTIYKDRANVFIVEKSVKEKYIKEASANHGVNFQILDTEACALARLAAYNNIEEALIIDFANTKTSFYGIKDGIVDMARVRVTGTRDFENLLYNTLGVSREEAREQMFSQGIFNKIIQRSLDSLLNSAAIIKTINYQKVIITGGGAQLNGLEKYLEQALNKEVSTFELPGGLSPYTDAIAFGAALYDIAGKEKVNFRETQKSGISLPYKWAALFLIPLFLFSISMKIEESHLRKRNKIVQNTITEKIREVIPDVGTIKAPKSQVEALLKQKKSGGSEGSYSALNIFSQLADAQKDLEVSLYEVEMTQGGIKIKGESDSFQTIEKLNKNLEVHFAETEIQEQTTKPNGKVAFQIKLESSTGEVANGQ